METTFTEKATTAKELKNNPQKKIHNHHKGSRKKNVRKVKIKMKNKKKTVFSCDICNKQFAGKDLMQRHKGIHTTSRSFKCDLCEFTCKVSGYLARHVRRMHGGKRGHVCGICGNEYLFRSKLEYHMLVHTGEKPFKCDVCGKAFNTTYSLTTHKFIHTNEKPFKCSYCDYACRDSSTLRKHQARHTGLQRLYKCKICEKTMINKWQLKNHIAEEHLELDIRKHQCAECGQRFKVKNTLSKHIRAVHERSTRVTCEVCGVSVSNKGNLRLHLLTHVNARPYKCTYDGCRKAYKDNTALRRHIIVHYPEKQSLCEICNRTFSRETRLKRHLLQHMPRVKNLECHHCGARFFNKNYLAKHIRLKHTGKRKRYMCDMCGFVTHNKPSIVMHIKYGHVSENERKCKRCNKTFKRNVYLKLHYIRTHGVRYKTKERNPKVVIKEEPEDIADQQSIDLLEIEKHEILDDLNHQLHEAESDVTATTQKSTEDAAIDIIRDNSKHLNRVPDTIFDDLYIDSIVNIQHGGKMGNKMPGRKNKYNIDRIALEQAERSVRVLLTRVRQKEEVKTLERTRQQYNERMKVAASGINKREEVKLEYFNNNESNKTSSKKRIEKKSRNDSVKDKSLNDKQFEDTDREEELEKNKNLESNNDSYNDKSLNTIQSNTNDSDEELELNESKLINNKNDSLPDEVLNDNQSINGEQEQEINKNYKESYSDSTQDKSLDDKQSERSDSKEVRDNKNDKQCTGSEELELNKDEANDDNVSLDGEQLDDKNDSDWKEQKVIKTKRTRKRTKMKYKMRNKVNKKEAHDNDSLESVYENDSDWKEEEITNNKVIKSNKINFNTHQCYTCFKLYDTKEKLLEHCKDHFDVCSNISLKKCPLCDYVSKNGLRRHMKLRHNIKMNVPYAKMKDKKHNNNGSRYYFEVNNPQFNRIEVIPSVKNLNKMACTEIDRKNRERKANFVAKTKLVKKGKEWIVINEKIKVNSDDFILPELVNEGKKETNGKANMVAERNDSYVDRMKRLSVLAKKNGKKMMFPCEKCEKICRNLAALILHSRKHDPNAKPFKPKVWKHKQKVKITESPEVTEKRKVTEKSIEDNRKAKPKPIVNKHKCDPKLKKFYENNIRGKDIEFWQFLKIYNKMDRENVMDFGDLENRIDFGIHSIIETEKRGVTENSDTISEKTIVTEKQCSATKKPETLTKVTENYYTKVTKKKVIAKKKVFKRVIRISKIDYMRRNAIKNELREKIAKRCTVTEWECLAGPPST